MADAVYSAFDSFDFENNERFQRGWATVKSILDSDAVKREYLKAKAFFFSKYIQSFDFEKYLTWKKTESEQQQSVKEDSEKSETVCDKDNDDTSSEKVQLASANEKAEQDELKDSDLKTTSGANVGSALTPDDQSDQMCENEMSKQSQKESFDQSLAADVSSSSQCKELKEDSLNEQEKEDSLSLAELAVLLQNDLPIPGLISVDVQPSNKDPTPSSLTRKPKPWEMKNSKDQVLEEEIKHNSDADS